MLYITDQHPRSPGTWALCADGAVVEQYPGHLGATLATHALRARQGAVTAAAGLGELVPWEDDGGIAFIGVPTGDKRILDDMSFRAFPLDLLAQTETAFGHDGAFLVGRIDSASVEGNAVRARGIIDPAIPGAADVLRAMENGMLTRISIDYTADARLEVLEEDADGFPVDYVEHHFNVKMGAATLVSMSAFENARVRLTSVYAVTASAVEIPVNPPVEWFADPQLKGRTRLTVTDEGRVFGHLAPWGECHIGIQGQCVVPPQSATGYAWFQLGTLKCAEGCRIPIGTITMDTGHADKSLGARAAASHYDNTGLAVADVAVGEDAYGIWVAGALRPSVTPEQARALGAARLSGDWRQVNGQLELIAALAVNVGGFPVFEEAIAADGSVQTLIASVPLEDEPPKRIVSSIPAHVYERYLQPKFDERATALRERVHTVT